MIVPDCRHDSCYNEDFLDKEDKAVVNGYDMCMNAVETVFSNLDVILQNNGFLLTILQQMTNEKSDRTYADVLSDRIRQYLENERNNYIICKIDGMDEAVYKKQKRDAIEKNNQSNEPKQYYDTRRYFATGRKE